ncbi:MAG: hypothetical protein ABFD00_02420 [Chloroherpetonaceae bacterium]
MDEEFTKDQIIEMIRINRKDIKHWESARKNAETFEQLDTAEKNLYRHMLRQIRFEEYLEKL